jgi:hypothetical protein
MLGFLFYPSCPASFVLFFLLVFDFSSDFPLALRSFVVWWSHVFCLPVYMGDFGLSTWLDVGTDGPIWKVFLLHSRVWGGLLNDRPFT